MYRCSCKRGQWTCAQATQQYVFAIAIPIRTAVIHRITYIIHRIIHWQRSSFICNTSFCQCRMCAYGHILLHKEQSRSLIDNHGPVIAFRISRLLLLHYTLLHYTLLHYALLLQHPIPCSYDIAVVAYCMEELQYAYTRH